jgi:hypothetical protein
MFKHLPLLLAALFTLQSQLASAVSITSDDSYIYYKYNWNEMSDDRQKTLMEHFYTKLSDKVTSLGIPRSWSEKTEQKLFASNDEFKTLMTETQREADQFTQDPGIRVGDLVPTGFIVGIGVNGSGNYIAGIGGTLLMTLIVVPLEVKRIDKITLVQKDYYECAWAIGGFGQAGIGIGGGGGAAFRGAAGLIWGPLPNPAGLLGFAVGAAADIKAVAGLGIKGAVVFNSSTKMHNLVAMGTFDIGAQVGGELHAAGFYFLSYDQIAGALQGKTSTAGSGKSTVDAGSVEPITEQGPPISDADGGTG